MVSTTSLKDDVIRLRPRSPAPCVTDPGKAGKWSKLLTSRTPLETCLCRSRQPLDTWILLSVFIVKLRLRKADNGKRRLTLKYEPRRNLTAATGRTCQPAQHVDSVQLTLSCSSKFTTTATTTESRTEGQPPPCPPGVKPAPLHSAS